MKKNQMQKAREEKRKSSEPKKARSAHDAELFAEQVTNALGMFGAVIGAIGAFSTAIKASQQQPIRHTVKEADPGTVDTTAEVISSQIKK